LLVSRPDNGKSSILDYFAKRHPVVITEAGSPLVPVVSVEMPPNPTESAFWSELLWAMSITHRSSDKSIAKARQAKQHLAYVGARVLLIDEFNNVSQAKKEAPVILAAIRNLGNELRISVVAAGTEESINVLHLDKTLRSRFSPIVLPKWSLDRQYLKFLASLESIMPLAKPSNLAGRELAPIIFGRAQGALGDTVRLIRKTTELAIESGVEQITDKLVREVKYATSSDLSRATAEI
jgi:hypothetical protein